MKYWDQSGVVILCRLRWTSRRRTPLGGGQNDTQILSIIFYVLNVLSCLYDFMCKSRGIMSKISQLTPKSRRGFITYFMFPLLWLKCYEVTQSFCSPGWDQAAPSWVWEHRLVTAHKRNQSQGLRDLGQLFDCKPLTYLFLGKASLDIRLGPKG